MEQTERVETYYRQSYARASRAQLRRVLQSKGPARKSARMVAYAELMRRRQRRR